MGILERYILKEFLKIFGLTLGALMLIYLAIDFFDQVRRFVDKDTSATAILAFFSLKIPRILFEMTPLAALFTSVLAMGHFSRSHEITAIKASGISLTRVMAPILLVGLALGILLLLANRSVIAQANHQSKSIKQTRIEKKAPAAFFRQERVWLRLDRQTLFNVQLMEPSEEAMYGVTLYRLNPDFSLEESLQAKEMRYQNGRWMLIDGVQRLFFPDRTMRIQAFDSHPVNLDHKPEDFYEVMPEEEEMTYPQLKRYQERLERDGLNASRYEVEMANRTALPFITVVMLLVGVPSGLLGGARAGVAKGIGLCLVIASAYWVILSLSIAFGQGGVLPPWVAAWLANVGFGAIGAYLFLNIRQ